MNILFIYPEYPETFWSYSHAMKFIQFKTKKASFPPLGILTVSSLLPSTWQKRLVDLNVQTLNDSDIQWADMVMISAMVVQKQSIHEIISRVKKIGKPITVGGPIFSDDTVADFPGVDHFLLGEGELSIPPFIEDFEAGRLKKVYHAAGKPALCDTPIPDWSLINFKSYATMMVQYSRGCPFDCEFCDITKLFGRVPRTKEPQQIVAELDSLYRAGWKGRVFIVDDNFIGNKVRAKEALVAIIEWLKENNYPFTFLTEASINLAEDDELMELMIAANINSVFIGLETPDEKALLESNKVQNTRVDTRSAVRLLQEKGFQVQAGFIVGFDSDDETIFDRQIEYIQEIGVVAAMVGILTALHGTKLYTRLEKEGRLIEASSGNNTDGILNFVPKMDPNVLVTGYKRLISTIYSHEESCKRILTFLKHYNPRYKLTSVDPSRLLALFRVIFHFGLVGRGRRDFWKVIFITLKSRPKAFADVITLFITCYHCRQIAKDIV